MGLPSKRYLNLIITGAKEAQIEPEYIKWLEAQPYYITPQNIKEKRQNMPQPDTLPKYSYRELRKEIREGNQKYVFVGLLGYILKVKKRDVGFQSHVGRDITARQLRHLRGQ